MSKFWLRIHKIKILTWPLKPLIVILNPIGWPSLKSKLRFGSLQSFSLANPNDNTEVTTIAKSSTPTAHHPSWNYFKPHWYFSSTDLRNLCLSHYRSSKVRAQNPLNSRLYQPVRRPYFTQRPAQWHPNPQLPSNCPKQSQHTQPQPKTQISAHK